jgi:nucleoside-diphosphate-sugar epimerase
MFTSGPAQGEAIGSCGDEPLYHASLNPAEYEQLLARNGFMVMIMHGVERILVIGGTGVIGSQVVRQLLSAGHEVAVLHRGRREPADSQGAIHFHSADSELPIVHFPPEAVAWSPAVVIHMIAMGTRDTEAFVETFGARVARCVVISSGDVYAAYGRFAKLEGGLPEPAMLTEESRVRSVLHPYRAKAVSRRALEYWYDKLLVERTTMTADCEWVLLRLPKVFGPGANEDLGTVFGSRHHPEWRWTHGFVPNVAFGVALAATHPRAARRIYNLGEPRTPTMGERLAALPHRETPLLDDAAFDFRHDLAYDTSRIRLELGYHEPVDEIAAMRLHAKSFR